MLLTCSLYFSGDKAHEIQKKGSVCSTITTVVFKTFMKFQTQKNRNMCG